MIIKQTITLVAVDEESGREIHRVTAKTQNVAAQLKHVSGGTAFVKRAWESLREGLKDLFPPDSA